MHKETSHAWAHMRHRKKKKVWKIWPSSMHILSILRIMPLCPTVILIRFRFHKASKQQHDGYAWVRFSCTETIFYHSVLTEASESIIIIYECYCKVLALLFVGVKKSFLKRNYSFSLIRISLTRLSRWVLTVLILLLYEIKLQKVP